MSLTTCNSLLSSSQFRPSVVIIAASIIGQSPAVATAARKFFQFLKTPGFSVSKTKLPQENSLPNQCHVEKKPEDDVVQCDFKSTNTRDLTVYTVPLNKPPLAQLDTVKILDLLDRGDDVGGSFSANDKQNYLGFIQYYNTDYKHFYVGTKLSKDQAQEVYVNVPLTLTPGFNLQIARNLSHLMQNITLSGLNRSTVLERVLIFNDVVTSRNPFKINSDQPSFTISLPFPKKNTLTQMRFICWDTVPAFEYKISIPEWMRIPWENLSTAKTIEPTPSPTPSSSEQNTIIFSVLGATGTGITLGALYWCRQNNAAPSDPVDHAVPLHSMVRDSAGDYQSVSQ